MPLSQAALHLSPLSTAFQTHFQGWTVFYRKKQHCSTKKQNSRPPSNLYETSDKLGFGLWKDNTQLWGGDLQGWWKINYTKKKKKKNEEGVTDKVKEVKGSFQLTTEICQRQVVKKGPLSSTHSEIYFTACSPMCEEEPGAMHHLCRCLWLLCLLFWMYWHKTAWWGKIPLDNYVSQRKGFTELLFSR